MTEYSPAIRANTSRQHAAVIVLGVDTPIGVAILRDLGRNCFHTIGIGRSRNAIGLASRYCNEGRIRAGGEPELVKQLLQLAADFPNASLLVVSESDNLLINRNRAELERYLRVVAPDQAMLEQVLDKSRCIRLADGVGIRVPDTFAPSTFEEVEQYANDLTYPRVIKWADPNQVALKLEQAGLTAHKCQYAHSPRDLLEKLRPYVAINKFPLVQEYCPGRGIGQMFLVRDGEIALQFQHERIHEWPPEGGVSSLCKSVPLSTHKACRERSARLLQALRWNGVAMVEYRYDSATDNYFFMEINGRFWGSLPLAIASGVPFATGLVASETDKTNAVKQPDYSELYCRFMIPEVRRLARLLFQPKSIQDPYYRYSPTEEIWGFFSCFFRPGMRYYLFSISDPGPFLADIRNIITKAIFRRG